MAETKCGFNDSENVSGAALLTRYGPTLFVNIGFDETFKGDAIPATIPIAGIKDVQALVDTGASVSCIDALLATELGLPIVDRVPIGGVGGRHMVNMYLAQIHVPSLNFTIYGSFAGVNLVEGGQVHKALIGRTFLENFTMTYEGKTGTVTITS
ncbi:MAG: retroviral-like aspartic protease family protein [Minisyncoccia bacterium]